MALRECPDCGKPLSTAAAICPHCGCPVRRGSKRRSYLGPLLIIFLILITWASIIDQRKSQKISRDTAAIATPRCHADGADAIVKKATPSVIHRIDRGRSIPRVYVADGWYGMTIDEKTAFDGVLQCHLTRGIGTSILLVYHDHRTGNEVAEADSYGFRMH